MLAGAIDENEYRGKVFVQPVTIYGYRTTPSSAERKLVASNKEKHEYIHYESHNPVWVKLFFIIIKDTDNV